MLKTFPVYHSLLSTKALIALVQKNYHDQELDNCQLIRMGLNDTYLVTGKNKKFILRVYRHTWRSQDEINAEIELLTYLKEKKIPISEPIINNKNQYLVKMNAPEGERYAVLFSYLKGAVLALDEQKSFEYGKLIGMLHEITNNWTSKYPRFHLDTYHLINEPFQHIKSTFLDYPTEVAFLEKISERITKIINSLPTEPPYYGVCHGDHFGNSFLNNVTGQVFYDFDSYGEGWRIYDVAQFYWAIKLKLGLWSEQYLCPDEVLWQSFLKGYQTIRSLTGSEVKAIPAFLVARAIWGLGLQPANSEHFGIAWLDDIFHLSYSFILDVVNKYTAELDAESIVIPN